MIKTPPLSPSADPIKDTALNRSILWKIYFYIITLLSVFSLYSNYLDTGSGITEAVSIILFVPAKVGLFGYVFSKKIRNYSAYLDCCNE